MAISRRKNRVGRITGYTVTVSERNPEGGHGRRHVIGTYTTKVMAERAEREAKSRLEAGTFAPRRSVVSQESIADFVELWLETRKGTVEPNTYASYLSAAEKHVLPVFGAFVPSKLTHDEVQRVVNGWRDNPKVGAQLIHRSMLVLRGALDRALRSGKVTHNVVVGIEKPTVKKRRNVTGWTPEQRRRFLKASAEDQLFPFWHFALLEGMRRGEILGLRWSDVEWGTGDTTAVAHIRQTIVADLNNAGRPLQQERAKTRRSERVVSLTTPTVEALKVHRDRQRFRQRIVANALIVTDEVGAAVTPYRVQDFRTRLMTRADVPQISTHDLRHLSATTMLAAGVSPALVAAKLGHESIATTVDTYGHIIASDQQAANDAIEAFLSRKTGTESD